MQRQATKWAHRPDESIAEVLHPSSVDRLVSVLPLHHAFEFTAGLLAPLAAGASIRFVETVSGQIRLPAGFCQPA